MGAKEYDTPWEVGLNIIKQHQYPTYLSTCLLSLVLLGSSLFGFRIAIRYIDTLNAMFVAITHLKDILRLKLDMFKIFVSLKYAENGETTFSGLVESRER